jgi:hypothetical protein
MSEPGEHPGFNEGERSEKSFSVSLSEPKAQLLLQVVERELSTIGEQLASRPSEHAFDRVAPEQWQMLNNQLALLRDLEVHLRTLLQDRS